MILIGTNDPGPLAYLMSLSNYLDDIIWVKNKILTNNHSSVKSISDWQKTKPNMIITGTSIGFKLDKKLVKFGIENNIPTIVCVESWENIKQRFEYKRKKFIPNYIIVNDNIAYKQCILNGISKSILYTGGNPLLEFLYNKKKNAKKIKIAKRRKKKICFISEPFSETSKDFKNKFDFDEFSALKDLINIIDFDKFNLTIKLHPKDRIKKYSKFINSNIQVKNKISKNDLLYSYDFIIGMTSMLLVELAYLNKTVYSYTNGSIKRFFILNHYKVLNRIKNKNSLKEIFNNKKLNKPINNLPSFKGSGIKISNFIKKIYNKKIIMKYCKNCLQPDTRPNTKFTTKGICPACNYHKTLKNVDWDERLKILKDYVSGFPKCVNGIYDCIIGVSGGKDSTRQALWVRDKLGLNPLLVSFTYPPEQIELSGTSNLSNLINLGFDVENFSPAPQTYKKLLKDSFFKFSNWARAPELALHSVVPLLAIKHKIQLVFWGENPALQVGDLTTQGKNGFDGNNLRYANTLSSGHKWMLKNFQNNQIIPYIYPSVKEFEKNKIQIVYLGWFLGDWSLVNNANYSCLKGITLKTDPAIETGDLYGISNLDENFHNINHMFKYYKLGFGKTTEYLNEEIRANKITKENAIKFVKKYDGRCSKKTILDFCKYLEISFDEFNDFLIKATNKKLFKIKRGKIIPRFDIGKDLI